AGDPLLLRLVVLGVSRQGACRCGLSLSSRREVGCGRRHNSQPNFDILWHAQLSPRLEETLRRHELIILLGGSTAFGNTRTIIGVAPQTQSALAGSSGRVGGSAGTSTTLADLFTLLFAANPFSAARASLRRWSSDEFEDGLAHGGQCRSRRWP